MTDSVREPAAVRVPKQSFLKMTSQRKDCSEWLLVGCTPSCSRNVKSRLYSRLGSMSLALRFSAPSKPQGAAQMVLSVGE